MDIQNPRKLPFALLRDRGELPHLYKPGCTYFVTFCLRDSGSNCGAGFQPAEEECSQDGRTTITAIDPETVAFCSEPPSGLGSCVLSDPRIAQMVQNALLHFQGERYDLLAWCIMPNHVHVVVTPLGTHSLSQILHSWKSFTANAANKLLGEAGVFWERESFDHVIRSPADLVKFVEYTGRNPVAAGLCDSPDKWPYSSCGAGFQPARETNRECSQDGRTTRGRQDACTTNTEI